MKKIFTSKNSGPIRLVLISIVTTALLGIGYVSSSADKKDILSVKEGITTCSHRVAQSFTAKMIGDKNSVYMQNDFMNMSEDCFADVVANFNSQFANKLQTVTNQINQMTSLTHQLHEKILIAGTDNQTLGSLYEKIESARNFSLDELDNFHSTTTSSNKFSLFGVITSFLLLAGLVLYELYKQLNLNNALFGFDNVAKNELVNQEENRNQNAEELLSTVFNKVGLVYCSQLFQTLKSSWNDKAILAQYKSGNDVRFPQVTLKPHQIEQAEVIVANVTSSISNHQNNAKSQVNLTDVMTKVVNLVSGKAFSNGVILDVDLNAPFYVKGDVEAVQQIIYNLFSHSINNNLNNQTTKRIRSQLLSTNGKVVLKLTDSSQIYTQEMVMNLNSEGQITTDPGLAICKEFVKECEGEIHAKNQFDAAGNIASSLTEVMFVEAKPVNENKTVIIHKGKKKDFRKKFKNRSYQLEA